MTPAMISAILSLYSFSENESTATDNEREQMYLFTREFYSVAPEVFAIYKNHPAMKRYFEELKC